MKTSRTHRTALIPGAAFAAAAAGVTGMVAVTVFSTVAPASTPKEAVAHAHKHSTAALGAPDGKQKFVRAESQRWSVVMKIAGVTVE